MVQVWLRVRLWEKVQRACNNFNCVADSIFLLVQDLSRDESQRIAALLWSLWKHRNLKLLQSVSEIVAHVVDKAIHLTEDWSMANTPSVTANNSSTTVVAADNSNSELNSSHVHPSASVVCVPHLFRPFLHGNVLIEVDSNVTSMPHFLMN